MKVLKSRKTSPRRRSLYTNLKSKEECAQDTSPTNDRICTPDRSRPGTTTAFPIGHRGGNDKCATGARLCGREDTTIATGNVRTLRAAGKVEELLHEVDRYK